MKNNEPIIIFETPNNFEISYTHMKRKRNFNNYTDKDLDKKVLYNGKVIEIADLPVVDFYSSNSFKFSHNVKISNFIISNFISYISKSDALIKEWDRNQRMTSYKKVKIPSYTTWDMRISYSQNLYNDINFFANLDINNILNKKYAVSKDLNNGEIYNTFDSGRNIWLEMGLKW